MTRTIAYIGLGANLGDGRATVLEAIAALHDPPSTALISRSALFRSAPVDADGPDFVNAVAKIDTLLDAHALLDLLHDIERRFGRERAYRNAPRTLDLDLLLFGDLHIRDDRLTVPHPRLTQRAFVLLPLLQIDPFLTIPGVGPAHACVPGVADQRIDRIAETEATLDRAGRTAPKS